MAITDGMVFRAQTLGISPPTGWQLAINNTATPDTSVGGQMAATNAGTFAIWCYGTTNSQGTALRTDQLINGTNSAGHMMVRYSSTTSLDKWYARWATTTANSGLLFSPGGTAGPDGSMIHHVITRDGDVLKQYTNGVLNATHTGIGTDPNAPSSGSGWNIGHTNLPVTSFFAWNRALSDAEVLELYQAGQDNLPGGGPAAAYDPFAAVVFKE